MQSKLILLGTVAALSIAAASQGQAHHQGWYIALEGGGNWVSDNDALVGLNFPPIVPATVSFDTGWAALATLGYGFESNWRIELEGGYRSNEIDTVALFGTPFTVPGDMDEISVMVNVLYDIPLTERLDFTIGLGAGADYTELDPDYVIGPNQAGDDGDWNFAYQAVAGLSYAVTSRLDVTMTYRYLNVSEPAFNVPRGPFIDNAAFEDLEKHTVTIGLRYDLYEDEAPPPPMAPPAPPPPPPVSPEQFIIYFAFDKCSITQEADKVLDEAAGAAKTGKTTTVSIVGHTDTSGSTAYNQRLSDCRAGAAKSNLVNKGIPADSITTSGRGESELLVKTGDGVKEPQNRRATIDLN